MCIQLITAAQELYWSKEKTKWKTLPVYEDADLTEPNDLHMPLKYDPKTAPKTLVSFLTSSFTFLPLQEHLTFQTAVLVRHEVA